MKWCNIIARILSALAPQAAEIKDSEGKHIFSIYVVIVFLASAIIIGSFLNDNV